MFTDPKPKPSYVTPKELADIFNSVQKDYVQNADTDVTIDPTGYDFTLKTGVNPDHDLYRAKAQSNWAQAGNAVGRVIGNITPEVLGSVAAIADLPGYFNDEAAASNWMTDLMNDWKENVNEALPIYREKPNEFLDWGDPAWWFEYGSAVATSAGGFAVTGALTGIGISRLGIGLSKLSKLAQASKVGVKVSDKINKYAELSNALGGIAKGAQKTGNFVETYSPVLKTVANAYALNHAEGVLEAGGTYDQVYQNAIEGGFTEGRARREASLAAARVIKINRGNIFLNMTSAGAFVRGAKHGLSRKLLKDMVPGHLGKRIALEAAQEYAEETINAYAGKKSYATAMSNLLGEEVDSKYIDPKMMTDLVFSLEGFEAGFWGAVGGAAQTGFTAIGQGKGLAQDKKRIEAIKKYQASMDKAALGDGKQNFFSFGVGAEVLQELNTQKEALLERHALAVEGQDVETAADVELAIEQIDSKILRNQALAAFQQFQGGKLISSYKAIENMTDEEASDKGYNTDPTSSEYYKTKTEKALKEVAVLENIYNKTGGLANRSEMFDNRLSKYDKSVIKKEALAEISEINSDLANIPEILKEDGTLNNGPVGKKRQALRKPLEEKLIVGENNLSQLDKEIDKLDVEYREGTSLSKQKEINQAKKDIFTRLKEKLKDKKNKARKQDKLAEKGKKEEESKLKERTEQEEIRAEENGKESDLLRKKNEEDLKKEENDINDLPSGTKEERKLRREKKKALKEKRLEAKVNPISLKDKESLDNSNPKTSDPISKEEETKKRIAASIIESESGSNIIASEESSSAIEKIESLLGAAREGIRGFFNTIAFRNREAISREGIYTELSNDLNDRGKILLDNNKITKGTDLVIAVDTEYKGNILLASGEEIPWEALSKSKDLTEDEIIDYTPIAIKYNGEIVGYVPTHPSLENKKVSPTLNIAQELDRLKELRTVLINSKKPITTKITYKSAGRLFIDVNKELKPASEALTAPNTEYAIYRGGKLFIGEGIESSIASSQIVNYETVSTIFNSGSINGHTIALLPSHIEEGVQQYIASPLYRGKLNKDTVASIQRVLEVHNKYLFGQELTEQDLQVTEAIQDMLSGTTIQGKIVTKSSADITNSVGLKLYLSLFLNTGGNFDFSNPKSIGATYAKVGASAPVFISEKQGMQFTPVGDTGLVYAGDILIKPESKQERTAQLQEYLNNADHNLDLRHFGQTILKVPIVKADGTVVDINLGRTGIEYFSSTALQTPIRTNEVGTKEEPFQSNFVQPVITFDPAPIIGEKKAQEVEKQQQETAEMTDKEAIDALTEEFGEDADFFDLPLTNQQRTSLAKSLKSDYLLSSFNEIDKSGRLAKNFTSSIASQILNRVLNPEKAVKNKVIIEEEIERGINAVLQGAAKLKTKFPKFAALEQLKEEKDNLKRLIEAELNKIIQTNLTINPTLEENDTPTDDDLEERSKSKSYSDDSIMETNMDRMSSKLKAMLSYMPKSGLELTTRDVAMNKVFDSYLQEYEDINLVVSTMESILAETFEGNGKMTGNFNTMMDILIHNAPAYPFLENVVAILSAKDNEQFQNEFVKTMLKHYVQMRFIKRGVTVKGKPYLNILESNSDSKTRHIRVLWNNALGRSDISAIDSSNQFVTIDETVREALLKTLGSVVEADGAIARNEAMDNFDMADVFAAIGIDLDPKSIQHIKDGTRRMTYTRQFTEKYGIFNILYTYLSTDYTKPGSDLYDSFLVNDGIFKRLAGIESLYRPYHKSHVHRSNNKLISSYANHKFITRRASELMNDIELLTSLADADFTSESSYLKKYAQVDLDGKFRRQEGTESEEFPNGLIKPREELKDLGAIEYVSLSPLQSDRTKSEELEKLDVHDYEVTKLGFFFNKGASDEGTRQAKVIPATFSNNSIGMLWNISPIDVRPEADGTVSKSTVDYFYKHVVYPELKRMLSESDPNISGYEKGKKLFYFLPNLNESSILFQDGELKIESIEELSSVEVIKIKEDIKDHLSSLIADKIAYWKENDIINSADRIPVLDGAYSETIIEDGSLPKDPAARKKTIIDRVASDYVLNYLLADVNYHQLFAGDPALFYKESKVKDATFKDHIIATRDNIGKRLAAETAPGEMLAKFDDPKYSTHKQLFIEDSYSAATALKYLTENNIVPKKDLPKFFGNIETTNAVEYVSAEEFITNRFLLGEISKEEMDIFLKKESGEGLTSAEITQLLDKVGPQKPVYVGMHMEEGVERKLYIKSAEFPLLKSYVKGTSLQNLADLMSSQGIARAAFSSAVKVGNVKNPLTIFDGGGDVKPLEELLENIDVVEKATLVLNKKNLAYQQRMPIKNKGEVNASSQATKLLFQNIEKHLPKGLKDKFNFEWKTLYESSLINLRIELGMSEAEAKNLSNWNIDIKKLSDKLIKEAITRGYPVPDIKALEVIIDPETGENKFAIPLWATGSHRKIEAMLGSIVTNQVFKQKLPGNSYVLASDEGLKPQLQEGGENAITGIEFNYDKYDANRGLVASQLVEKQMTKNQVLVSWNPSWGLMESFKDNNGVFDWSKFDPEVLKGVGLRIPNQALNSSASMEIVGFLPSHMQNMIITPRDFIAQMGSDFDIDKLYTYWKNNHKNSKGDIVITTSENYKDSKIKESYNIGKIIDAQNSIIDIHQKVLNDPQHDIQREAKAALGFGKLEGLAEQYAPLQEKEATVFSPFSEQYNTNKYFNASAGNDAIGIFATSNTLNARLQNREVGFVPFQNNPLVFGENLSSNGDLSSIYDLTGEIPKSNFLNSLLSSAVDDEKEQILYRLNVTPETRAVVTAMAQLGFPAEIVIEFINQPIIKEISDPSAESKYRSELSKIIGTTPAYAHLNDLESREAFIESFLNQGITELKYNRSDENSNTAEYYASQIAVLKKYKRLEGLSTELIKVSSALNVNAVGKDAFEAIEKEKNFRRVFQTQKFDNIKSLFGDYKSVKNRENEIAPGEPAEAEGWVSLRGGGYFRPNTREGYAIAYALNPANKLWSSTNILPYNLYVVDEALENGMRYSKHNPNKKSPKQIAEIKRRMFNGIKSYLFSDLNNLGLSSIPIRELRFKILSEKGTKKGKVTEIISESLGTYVNNMKSEDPFFRSNTFLRNLRGYTDKNEPFGITNLTFELANDVTQNTTDAYIGLLTMLKDTTPLVKPFKVNREGVNEVQATTRSELAQVLIASQYAIGGIQGTKEFLKIIPPEYLQAIGFAKEVSDPDFFIPITDQIGGEFLDLNKIRGREHHVHPQIIQYFQHNLGDVRDVSYMSKKIRNNIVESFTVDEEINTIDEITGEARIAVVPHFFKFAITSELKETLPLFILADSRELQGYESSEELDLYKFDGAHYVRLESLSYNGMRQYDKTKVAATTTVPSVSLVAKSIRQKENILRHYNDINNPKAPVVGAEKATKTTEQNPYIEEFNLASEDISKVMEAVSTSSPDEGHRALASAFIEEFSDTTSAISFSMNPELSGRGRFYTRENHIDINPDQLFDKEDISEAILHEYGHAITATILRKYEKGETAGMNNKQIRAIESLISSYDLYVDYLGKERVDTFKEKFLSGKIKDISTTEDYLLYGALNIQEFVSMSLTNEEVRTYLMGIPVETKHKSFLDFILNKLAQVFEAFGIKKGTLAHDTFVDIFSIVSEQALIDTVEVIPRVPKETTDITPKTEVNLTEEEVIGPVLKDEDGNIIEIGGITETFDMPEDLSLGSEGDSSIDLNLVLSIPTEELTQDVLRAKQSTLRRLKKRKVNLDYSIGKSIKAKEKKRLRENRKEIQTDIAKLEEEVKKLAKVTPISVLSKSMSSDLVWAEKLLATEENTDYALDTAGHILSTWKRFIDSSKKLVDEDQAEILDIKFGPLESKINRLLTKLLDKKSNKAVSTVRHLYGINAKEALKTIFDPIKDLGKLAANLLDISKSNHVLLQAIQRLISSANRNAASEIQELYITTDDFITNAESKLKELGLDWDIFFRKGKDGELQDKIISPLSEKYIADNARRQRLAWETGSWGNYGNWFKNNHEILDLNRLNDPLYLEELKKKSPSSQAVQMAVDKAKYQLQKYELEREYQEDILKEKYSSESVKNKLIVWEELNDPRKVVKGSLTYTTANKNNYSKNFRYVVGLPKAQRLGTKSDYYDPGYEVIEKHEELSEFTSNFIDTLSDLNQFIPGTHFGDNFTIPLFQKTTKDVSMFKGGEYLRLMQDEMYKTLRGSEISNGIFLEQGEENKPQLSSDFHKKTRERIVQELEIEKSKFILDNARKPTKEEIRELYKIATDKVVKASNMNLGQSLRTFAALAITYKHKAQIETSVSIMGDVFKDKVKKLKTDSRGNPIKVDQEGQITPYGEPQTDGELLQYQIQLDAIIDTFFGIPKPMGGVISDRKKLTTEEKKEKNNLQKELENLVGEKDKIDDDFIDGVIDQGKKTELIEITNLKIKKIEGKIGELGIAKNLLTKSEKRLKKEYEKAIASYEERKEVLKELGLDEDALQEQVDFLNKEINSLKENIKGLGGKGTFGGYINTLMQFLQLKALGWNIPAGIANLAFGILTNNIEAAGELYYTGKQLNRAYRLTLTSIGKTVGIKSDTSTKIRKLMDDFNFHKRPSEEFFEGSNKRLKNELINSPYGITSTTEYLNQAPVMIAVFLNQTIRNKAGVEVSIWEAYNEVGEWKTEEFGPKEEASAKLDQAANTVDVAIRNNHGNYDNASASIGLKRDPFLKAFGQFRTWMFEGFANRFEGEYTDYNLGVVKKGRYTTYRDLGLSKSLATLSKIALKQEAGEELKIEDLVNMKKNLREIRNWITVYGAATILSMAMKAFGDDDEKEYAASMLALNFLINLMNRVDTDILFYIHPGEFKTLISGRDLAPITSLLGDIGDVGEAIYKFALGDDIIQSGVRADNSRLLLESMELLPGSSAVYKFYNNSIQVFKKDNRVIEDIIETAGGE